VAGGLWSGEGTISYMLSIVDPQTMAGVKEAIRIASAYLWLAKSWSHQPDWNFNKYLIDRKGRVAMRFTSSVEPDAPEVTRAISALPAEKA